MAPIHLARSSALALSVLLMPMGHASARVEAPAGHTENPDCVPVPGAECGTIRVPLDRSDPRGESVDVAYALIRHRNQFSQAAGTVVPNPGGPGGVGTIELAPLYMQALDDLLADFDLLLIDPRGIGRSDPLHCGLDSVPATRDELTRGVARCGTALGVRARAFTSAATADDIDDVRAHLGIRQLDLFGLSYGTYLLTVYAQRHPDHIRSIALSSAYPLDLDMWARPNARAMQRAIRVLCERSAGACDADGTLDDLAELAQRLRQDPVPYDVSDEPEPRLLDDTSLASIVYHLDMSQGYAINLGLVPAIVRAALAGDTGPLVAAAQATLPLSGSSMRRVAADLAVTLAVICNDYPTLWNRHAPIPVRLRQFEAGRGELAGETFYPFSARAWTSAIRDRGNTCVRWPDRHGPMQKTRGPFADVPVLVVSGELDLNTPTEESRLAARQYRHARVIEVPNLGHGPELFSGCVRAIMVNFVRTLQVGDISCLADIPPIPVP